MLNLEFPPVAWRSLLILRNIFISILFLSSIYFLYQDTIQINQNKIIKNNINHNDNYFSTKSLIEGDLQQKNNVENHYSLDKEQNWENSHSSMKQRTTNNGHTAEKEEEIFHFVANWGGYVYSNISSRSRSLFLLQWKLGENEFKGLLGILILMWSNLITIAVFLLLFSIYMLGFAFLMFVLISEG